MSALRALPVVTICLVLTKAEFQSATIPVVPPKAQIDRFLYALALSGCGTAGVIGSAGAAKILNAEPVVSTITVFNPTKSTAIPVSPTVETAARFIDAEYSLADKNVTAGTS
jgi:hypothetical protein